MEANKDGVFITYEEMKEQSPEALIAEAANKKVFYTKLVEYWHNGSYFTYRNEKTTPLGKRFAIRVNNDGSEDLVELHYNDTQSWFTTIENVTPKGEAKLWKETIEKGFMTVEETKHFIQKPKDRITDHSI